MFFKVCIGFSHASSSGLRQLEEAATQRMAVLQVEYEERRKDLQLKEAKERESRQQDVCGLHVPLGQCSCSAMLSC